MHGKAIVLELGLISAQITNAFHGNLLQHARQIAFLISFMMPHLGTALLVDFGLLIAN